MLERAIRVASSLTLIEIRMLKGEETHRQPTEKECGFQKFQSCLYEHSLHEKKIISISQQKDGRKMF